MISSHVKSSPHLSHGTFFPMPFSLDLIIVSCMQHPSHFAIHTHRSRLRQGPSATSTLRNLCFFVVNLYISHQSREKNTMSLSGLLARVQYKEEEKKQGRQKPGWG